MFELFRVFSFSAAPLHLRNANVHISPTFAAIKCSCLHQFPFKTGFFYCADWLLGVFLSAARFWLCRCVSSIRLVSCDASCNNRARVFNYTLKPIAQQFPHTNGLLTRTIGACERDSRLVQTNNRQPHMARMTVSVFRSTKLVRLMASMDRHSMWLIQSGSFIMPIMMTDDSD